VPTTASTPGRTGSTHNSLPVFPCSTPEGLHREEGLGPGDALKRAVKRRSNLVMRRTTAMHRLDALLEIMSPAWVEALSTSMNKIALLFLSHYADPFEVKRLGRARLTRFLHRHSRGHWDKREAEGLLKAAEATIALWNEDGLDFVALSEDIAIEARLALQLTDEIKRSLSGSRSCIANWILKASFCPRRAWARRLRPRSLAALATAAASPHSPA